MEINLLQRIQKSLLGKRQNIDTWLEEATPQQLTLQAGQAGSAAVASHLHVIDTTLAGIADGQLGMCDVCHQPVNTRLLEMDYTTCVCLDHYNAGERRQLESELEFSQAIQRALMPQQAPTPAQVDLSAFSRPAQIVNGDVFDFFKFRDGAEGLAIADAVGHGVPAGLLMASLQTALRLLVPENDAPVAVIERINQLFLHNHNFTTFATLFLARYEPAARRLVYSNAGHNPPLLYNPGSGALTSLAPTGAAIGLIEGYQIAAEYVSLAEGDALLLYTDGVTEAHNPRGEDYGLERLATLFQQVASLASGEIVRAIRLDLEGFLEGGPPEDDTTLVAIKFR